MHCTMYTYRIAAEIRALTWPVHKKGRCSAPFGQLAMQCNARWPGHAWCPPDDLQCKSERTIVVLHCCLAVPSPAQV